jgi:hypothetical protein
MPNEFHSQDRSRAGPQETGTTAGVAEMLRLVKWHHLSILEEAGPPNGEAPGDFG